MKRIILSLAICAWFVGKTIALEATNPPPALSLADAEKLALQNHPQIAAANYRALAAQEVVKEVRAGFLPTINAYGNIVGAEERNASIMAGGLNSSSAYDRDAVGLAANVLLFDFGHTANLMASSQFQAQAEKQNANVTREQVLLQVNAGYFGALEAQAILNVAKQTMATRQVLLDQVTVLASNKLKSELDVSFSRVAAQESKLLVQKAQNNADDAMTSLSTALGYREPHPFQLDEFVQSVFTNMNDVSELVETALAKRPELLSLRNEHEAAKKYARSQIEARLPVISAVGVMGTAPYHDTHLPDNYEAGGIQLTLPLFAGGLNVARQHEAELKAQADSELVRALENNIVRDVHVAFLNVNTALEQLRTTEELARNAAEAYELAQARYQIGSSSIVELSQAQLSLTSAQIANVNAHYNVHIQQAGLNYQIGTLR